MRDQVLYIKGCHITPEKDKRMKESLYNNIRNEGIMNMAMRLHEWEYESYDNKEADEADSIMEVKQR